MKLLCLILLTLQTNALFLSKKPRHHYWPSARGNSGSYGVSPATGPRKLMESFAWSWANASKGNKFRSAATTGVLIDDEKNIYLSKTDGINKFNADGVLQWEFSCYNWRIPALQDNKLFAACNNGTAFALDLVTGQPIWKTKYTSLLGMDESSIFVQDDVVVLPMRGRLTGGAVGISALNSKTGQHLWDFKADAQLWNVMPLSAGKDAIVFQDQIGGVYKVNLTDGSKIWKEGYKGKREETFTDGMAMVGPNGLFYAVHSDGPISRIHPTETSTLRAYDLESGKQMWEQKFTHPANSQPVIARLGSGEGLSEKLSLVMAIGAQPTLSLSATDYPSDIRVLDAKTGELQWKWSPPNFNGRATRSDITRITNGALPCLPNPFASPTVDASGTIFLGHFNGKLYSIRDDNGDNQISDDEVFTYEAGSGFSHGGIALAPGLMAVADCSTLYAFKA